LKIAGHAQNEQYQQYEQRPAAPREAISCVPGTKRGGRHHQDDRQCGSHAGPPKIPAGHRS
jgi:hypothetical protein